MTIRSEYAASALLLLFFVLCVPGSVVTCLKAHTVDYLVTDAVVHLINGVGVCVLTVGQVNAKV